MKICIVSGCDNSGNSHRITRGMCSKHYNRWLKYDNVRVNHQPHRQNGMSLSKVILYEIDRSDQSENKCLETKATIRKKDGYGQITFDGKAKLLHRLVLEQFLGRKLVKGEQANHLCHNTKCINPYHLYAGTQADNIKDMMDAGRSVNPHNHYSGGAVLSSTIAVKIRKQFRNDDDLNRLAKIYGVSRRCIKNVVHWKSWKHVA